MSLNINFQLALKSSNGSVWAWGRGTEGQLGDNTTTSKFSPVPVVGAHSFNAIATGQQFSLALKSSNGSVWAWGRGTEGQLGDNTNTSKSSPVSVVGAHSFNAISGGTHFALALKSSNGSVWAWGAGTSGQLGDDTTTSKSSPVSVIGAHSFNAISGGDDSSFALKSSNGSVWAWGAGTIGELGDNTNTSKSSPVSVVGAHSFNAIAAGRDFTLALKSSNGSAWAWGAGVDGTLGDNTITSKSSPVSVVGAHSFNAIAGGTHFSLALKSSNGSAWAWGLNSSGQLGDNTNIDKSSPVSVVGAQSFAKISAGDANSYGLKADGTIWVWGSRSRGALGDGTDSFVSSPVSVIGAHSFNSMSAGDSFSLALKSSNGSVWAWGAGTIGELGDNTNTSKSSPVSVVGAHSFNAVAGGASHSLALKPNNGTVWSWGLGTSGQLGNNTITTRSSPVSVVGAHSFNAIAAGDSFSLALKSSNGSAWAWGLGISGQLGDDTTTSKSSPVSVVGAHSFNSIATGTDHSLALKSTDGSAWAWGVNFSGQLGDDTTTSKSSPVSVVGAHSFNAIAAGSTHSLALKSVDGSAWAWGSPSNGQLGNNNFIITRSSPVSVVGAHSFNSIAAGTEFSLALKSVDGSAWAWGLGTSGQLGDNTVSSKSSPVSVVGAHSFTKISAGDINSYALKADGSVWSWGSRSKGALGDGTDSFVSSPKQVVVPTPTIKTILGLPYTKFGFNDITTGPIVTPSVPSVKTINGVNIDSIKSINGNQ